MLAFMMTALFFTTALVAIIVLADSAARGVRAHQHLNRRMKQGNLGSIITIKYFDCGPIQIAAAPRLRLVSRTNGLRQTARAAAPRLNAAA